MRSLAIAFLGVLLLFGGLASFEAVFDPGVEHGVAAAQEGGVGKTRTLWDNIRAGGWCEATQIVLSIVGFALVIEHAVSIRRDKLLPPYLLSELEALLDEQDYEKALDLCDSEDCMISRVMGAALSKMDSGYDRMIETAIETNDQETTILNQKISYVSLIASIEPMMGLLGTVLGMISAFATIAAMAGMATAADLADGISMAMITTATGLIVAIPLTAFYTLFRNRILRAAQDTGIIAGELLERFKSAPA